MVKLDSAPGGQPGELTVSISGWAVFTHAKELEQALVEALSGCRHLTLDLTSVQQIDLSFPALVCCLHRKSELLHKEITLRGPPRRGRGWLATREARCPRQPGRQCRLWEFG